MNESQLALHLAFQKAGKRIADHLIAIIRPAPSYTTTYGDLMTHLFLDDADIMRSVVLPAVL